MIMRYDFNGNSMDTSTIDKGFIYQYLVTLEFKEKLNNLDADDCFKLGAISTKLSYYYTICDMLHNSIDHTVTEGDKYLVERINSFLISVFGKFDTWEDMNRKVDNWIVNSYPYYVK